MLLILNWYSRTSTRDSTSRIPPKSLTTVRGLFTCPRRWSLHRSMPRTRDPLSQMHGLNPRRQRSIFAERTTQTTGSSSRAKHQCFRFWEWIVSSMVASVMTLIHLWVRRLSCIGGMLFARIWVGFNHLFCK